jgi:hypothetical protein
VILHVLHLRVKPTGTSFKQFRRRTDGPVLFVPILIDAYFAGLAKTPAGLPDGDRFICTLAPIE